MTATNDLQPTLNGYVINPSNCTIKPVRVRQDAEGLTLQHLYELIDCDTVEALTMAEPADGAQAIDPDDGPPCVTLWFNENRPTGRVGTVLVQAPYPCTLTPVRGVAVLLGTDAEGACVDCPWPIEKVAAQFWWMGGPCVVRADHLSPEGLYAEPEPAAASGHAQTEDLSALRAAAANLLQSMETPRTRSATEAWDNLRAALKVTA